MAKKKAIPRLAARTVAQPKAAKPAKKAATKKAPVKAARAAKKKVAGKELAVGAKVPKKARPGKVDLKGNRTALKTRPVGPRISATGKKTTVAGDSKRVYKRGPSKKNKKGGVGLVRSH